jgi:hypothetical protein
MRYKCFYKYSAMKEPKALGTISRGYARHEKDELRLRAVGIKTIYRGDRGETIDKFKMRRGELLGVINGLRAFGETRRDMVEAVKHIHAASAAIIDVESGNRSDRNGVELLNWALAKFIPTPEQARAMQEASMVARLKGR